MNRAVNSGSASERTSEFPNHQRRWSNDGYHRHAELV